MQIQDEIRAYIVENILFGDDELMTDEASFQDTGILDSAGFLEIIAFLEERYGVAIDDSDVVPENFDTLSRMSQYVTSKLNQKAPV